MKKTLSVIGVILCSVVCLLLFALETALCLARPAAAAADPQRLSDLLCGAGLSSVLNYDDNGAEIYVCTDNAGMTREEAARFINSDAFALIAGTRLGGGLASLTGGNAAELSDEDIAELLSDALSETDANGTPVVPEARRTAVSAALKNEQTHLLRALPHAADLINSDDTRTRALTSFLISDKTFLALIAATLGAVLLFIPLRASWKKWGFWAGFTSLAAAVAVIAAALLYAPIVRALPLSYAAQTATLIIAAALRKSLLIWGAGIALFGGLCLLFAFLSRRGEKKEKYVRITGSEEISGTAPTQEPQHRAARPSARHAARH